MKKSIIWIVVAVLLVGAAVAAFMLSSDERTAGKIEEYPVVCYLDLHQLAEKGAFEEFITHDNRSFVASLLSSQVDDSKAAQHLKDIIADLDAIGIDTKQPICCYLTSDFNGMVLVAKVLSAEKLDSTVSLISYFLKDFDEEALTVTTKGKTRSIEGEYFAVAYNESLIALACADSDKGILNSANEAVNRTKVDFSVFGAADFAVLVNVDKCLKATQQQVEESLSVLQQQYNAGDIDEEEYMAMVESASEFDDIFEPYAKYIGENARVMLSTTFDKGRLTFACNTEGINYGDEMDFMKRVNTDHLANLSENAYAVAGMGLDGAKVAQYIRDFVTDEMLESIGVALSSEIKMGMSIACDALETIDGGVTIALNSVKGDMTKRYDYYWDEYRVEPSINSVDAILLADVNDTYIIGNVAQFAGGYLNKVDAKHYNMNMMGYNFTMGQDDNLFHIGVNMTPAKKSPSALDANWLKDVKKSTSYIVLNVDAVMDSKFMSSVNKYLEGSMDKNERKLYRQVTDMISYIYVAADSYESAEFVIVFDDQDTNALKQINNLVMPTLINTCVSSIY